jgi:hypothetical protein
VQDKGDWKVKVLDDFDRPTPGLVVSRSRGSESSRRGPPTFEQEEPHRFLHAVAASSCALILLILPSMTNYFVFKGDEDPPLIWENRVRGGVLALSFSMSRSLAATGSGLHMAVQCSTVENIRLSTNESWCIFRARVIEQGRFSNRESPPTLPD